jgi:predicted nucleic acid-binding protein
VIVADTNLISYLLVQGERTKAARRVWQRDPDWRAPPLWRSEFLNVLSTSVRADVLTESDADRAWTAATRLLTGREIQPSGRAVLRSALRDRLSAYDSQFVVVAEDLGVQLVTGDRGIRKEALTRHQPP